MSDLQSIKVTDNHLGKITTFSGIEIDLRNPRPENIHIRDIASGLSKICRFGGQCREFYSVAQHSVLVACFAPERLKKKALFHDGSEAYLGDVVKPLKNILGEPYGSLEGNFEHVIDEALGIPPADPEDLQEIKKYDILALHIENEAIRQGNRTRMMHYMDKYDLARSDDQIGWPSFIAEAIFTAHFKNIFHNG